MSTPITRFLLATSALAIFVTAPAPAIAQDELSEARIRKIEAEIRALQRTVFPGGDGRFFEPEIETVDPSRPTVNNPSTTAVTDILVRLDAMEAQLQRLTGQTEENANRMEQMESRIVLLEQNLAALSAPPPAPMGPDAPVEGTVTTEQPGASQSNLEVMTGGASRVVEVTTQPQTEAAPGVAPDRLAAVQAIVKPQSSDEGDNEYVYGFRLWDAGFYPEAQQQLSSFVERFPDHWRTTYGRNLLGRAYLDDGKPREAAPWFLRNYQTDKQGARAGDSLLFLAQSMIALEDINRACIALAEFGETYPALATGRLMEDYEVSRSRVNCN